MAQRAKTQNFSLLCLTALVSACSGEVSSPLGPSGTGGPGLGGSGNGGTGGGIGGNAAQLVFECRPDARSSEPMRRLSRREYANSLRDVLRAQTNDATAATVMASAAQALDSIPSDSISKQAPFTRMDQAVSQAHVEAYFKIAEQVASALTSSDARLREILGSCSTASGEAATQCIDSFIETFGKRVLRHPLSATEKAFYRDVYATTNRVDKAGVADVIAVLLTSPSFVYQIEFGDRSVEGKDGLYQLTNHEIAARLSYQFWQSAPDDALLRAADRGELVTDEGFENALDHVLQSERAADALELFAREWFGLDAMRPLDSLVGDPVFEAFAGDDLPGPDLKEDAIKEFTESLRYHAFVKDEPLREWVESPYSFARTEELARIYGTHVWDGQNEPPLFPDGERAGALTRVALLATGSANTRPIMKGVTIRERMLCDHLASPPANAGKNPPDLSDSFTTREVVTALTEEPGGSCAGCHVSQINPLGFATENYDSLGRLRDKQKLFSETGELLSERPVDTASVPEVWLGDKTPSEGPQDLLQMVTDSGKVEACFARQFVRFSQARAEDEAVDGCALEAVRSSLANGESVVVALRKVALLPSFRQRLIASDG